MRVNKRYSDTELATVVDYLARALEAGAEHVAWLQTQPAVSRHHCRLGVPGSVPSGVAAFAFACAASSALEGSLGMATM